MSTADEAIVKHVRAALESERRVELHRGPLDVRIEDGAVVIGGEAASLAAKKVALRAAAAAATPRGVVDRVLVAVPERRGDGEIRDALCNLLTSEAELRDCTIRAKVNSGVETIHDAGSKGDGSIEIVIADGVVTLAGTVLSLSHKRLVGVLAWWTAGVRDVVDSLDVSPPEEDNDGELIDALGLVHEIDPVVRHDMMTVGCRHGVVTLSGAVRTEAERVRAEFDAWATSGVVDVVNRIEVRAVPGA